MRDGETGWVHQTCSGCFRTDDTKDNRGLQKSKWKHNETDKILKFQLLFCEMPLFRFLKPTSSKQTVSTSFEQENVDPDILIDKAVSL